MEIAYGTSAGYAQNAGNRAFICDRDVQAKDRWTLEIDCNSVGRHLADIQSKGAISQESPIGEAPTGSDFSHSVILGASKIRQSAKAGTTSDHYGSYSMSNNDGMGSDSSPPNDIERLGKLIETYLPKLVKRCERKISDRYKSKFDQDDIVGTVLRTLHKRVMDGKIKIGHDDAEFWTLLTSIATRKISNKVRSENTNKRRIDRESNAFEDFQSVLSREPGPEEAASFVDMLEWLSNQISAEEMEILNHRFEGRTNREIADLLGVVERTIGRKLRIIKEKMEGYI